MYPDGVVGAVGAPATVPRRVPSGLVKAACALAILAAAAAARAADDPILITLNEVKTHYRKHEIGEAAAALRRLNELAAAPEFAAARDRLLPALSFYTGVIQFELRDEAGSRLALERYFGLQPAANLDPGLYPKPFVKFFEKVKKEMADADRLAAPPSSPGSTEGGLFSYAEFAADDEAADAMDRDPEWGAGPVRFLFVADDVRRWKSAADEDARRHFQKEFWARRDPTPATPGNEVRREFARRVQYANARFSTETQRGAESDRGRVFILLGPPNYAGLSRIEQAEEGVSRATDDFTPRAAGLANPARTSRTTRLEPGSSRLDTGEKKGSREVWYYRSDRLAKELPFKELRFEFQTRAGYGIGVMQKDAVNLSVLSKMADLIAQPR